MRNASLLIALAIATTARADGERTLHLAVHGSVDGAVIRASIAKELGVDVVVVDGTCELPCLNIEVDGKNRATIVFAPRSGSPRQRTVKLGSNTSQWSLVITLLAGNVVRDEARDVLAGLPPRGLAAPSSPDIDPGEPPPAPPAQQGPPLMGPPGSGPEIAGPPIAGPEAGGPEAGGPEAGGPEAGGPEAGGPEAGDPEVPVVALGDPVVEPAAQAAVPLAPERREHRFLGLGFVPGLSTDFTHIGSVRHFLSIDLLVGVSGGSSGLSLAGIADIERGPVAGFQIAGITAITTDLAAGFQIAGIAAVARQVAGTQIAGIAAAAGEVDGVQIAGTAAVADRVDGMQIAGISSFSRSSADTQAGGIAAVSRGTAGTQVAGIAAVAGDNAGLQIGGITSVTRGSAGVQIAGIVNVAQRVHGLQLAPINVAPKVDGVQIGLINIGSADGFSFGLINIVPGGRYDLEAAIDSRTTGTLLFRHGGRRWHNVYGVGGHPVDGADKNDDVWMYGLGFGPSVAFDNTVIDLEAIGWQVNHGPRHESDISILGQLRLSIAHHWGPFALVAGGILNTYFTDDQQSPLILERTESGARMQPGITVTTWPSAFVGVRL
jgi:hypothetical protein